MLMKKSLLASLFLIVCVSLGAKADEPILATAFTDCDCVSGHFPAVVLDGDVNTYFETTKDQYTWVGLDLGLPHVITSINIVKYGECQLGVFQGANKRDFSDAIPLQLINQPIVGTEEVVLGVTCSRGVRYVRYVGPAGQHCTIAEIKVFGTPGEGDDSRLWQVTNLPTVVGTL